jgi:phosphohistidine phosphatase
MSGSSQHGPILWFLRHGKAEDPIGKVDFQRRLTDKGERQAAASGRTLGELQPVLGAVLSSPRVRALQTAEIATSAHGSAPEPIVFDELGGDYTLADLLAMISPWTDEGQSVVFVGHNPTMSMLLHDLTGDPRGLSTGTLAAADLTTKTLLHLIKPQV